MFQSTTENSPIQGPHILHLASWYPSAVHGTLGNFVRRHIEAISTAHSGEVWYAAPSSENQPLPKNTALNCGGFLERIAYFKTRKPMVLGTTRELLELAEQTDMGRFDVIHLHVAYPAGKAARTLSKRWNIPLVVTEHWTAYHKLQQQRLPFWRKWSMRNTLKHANLLCPVSEDLAESMRLFGGDNHFRVVPNVVDTELFHPQDEMADKSPGTFQWLHISSLSDDQKNISGIIRAIHQLRKKTTSFHVQIIGDGDPEPHRTLVNALGLNDCITVLGEITLAEVANKMRLADALLLFSRYENFPCVIAEAWASGIPVLSSDVGGIREHLTPNRGALVKSEDEVALTKSMLQWIKAEKRFNSAELRSHALNHFSVEAIANNYSEVYREALERANPIAK